MDKKKIKPLIVVVIVIVAVVVLARIIYLNRLYPNPKVITYESNETIKIGNYDIKQSGWEWGDGNLIKNKCPDYVYMETSDGTEFSLDRERAGLVTLSVTKVKADTTTLDITNIAFEVCNNGTQFDMELFYELNPSIDSMDISLKEGENVSIILPVIMNDEWFDDSTWSKIDNEDIYMVFQYYPQKIQLCCR